MRLTVPSLAQDALDIPKTAHAKEEAKLWKELDGMRIGYSIVNLVDENLTLKFGEWNPRPINDGEVKKLRRSLEAHSIRIEESPIPLVLPRSLVVDGCFSATNDGTSTPFVQWTDSNPVVTAAGGQHRTEAMRQMRAHAVDVFRKQTIQKAITKLTASIQKKDNESKTAKSEDDRFAAKDDVEKFVSEKAMKEEELATNMKMQNVGIWVAVLYDEGQYVISAVTLDADSRRSLLSCGLRSNRQVEGESQQLQVRDATIVQPTDALV